MYLRVPHSFTLTLRDNTFSATESFALQYIQRGIEESKTCNCHCIIMATQTNTTTPEINSHQGNTSQPTHHDTKFDHNPEQYGTTATPHYAPPQYAETASRMVTPLHMLGEEPAVVDCPFCQQTTTTKLREEHSTMTWYQSNQFIFSVHRN
jgi:hypothetical protein